MPDVLKKVMQTETSFFVALLVTLTSGSDLGLRSC